MITITQLHCYPVKSCAGIALQEALVTETGLAHDREWMLVSSDNVAVTQREQPRLALIQPEMVGAAVRVGAPDMTSLMLDSHFPAGEQIKVDLFGELVSTLVASPEADAWFTRYLGQAVRLVRRDPSFHRKGGVQYSTRDLAPTALPDNYGVLLVSEASLRELNKRLGDPVPMNRFRPNIVVDGVEAFDEDHFVSARTSGAKLRFVNPCYRCNLTTIDQETGVVGNEPLATLSGFRRESAGVAFGDYAVVAGGVGQMIRVGETVDATLSF